MTFLVWRGDDTMLYESDFGGWRYRFVHTGGGKIDVYQGAKLLCSGLAGTRYAIAFADNHALRMERERFEKYGQTYLYSGSVKSRLRPRRGH